MIQEGIILFAVRVEECRRLLHGCGGRCRLFLRACVIGMKEQGRGIFGRARFGRRGVVYIGQW
jgi:hypothetical protein